MLNFNDDIPENENTENSFPKENEPNAASDICSNEAQENITENNQSANEFSSASPEAASQDEPKQDVYSTAPDTESIPPVQSHPTEDNPIYSSGANPKHAPSQNFTPFNNSSFNSADNPQQNTGYYGSAPSNTGNAGSSAADGANRTSPYSSPYQQRPYAQYQSTAGNPYHQSAGATAQAAPPSPPTPPKKFSTGKKILCILLAIVVVAASAGIGVTIGKSSFTSAATTDAQSNVTETSTVTVAVESTKASKNTLTATEIAENVRSCVVGVMTYKNGELSGEGSGVILCENGGFTYIITCAHVISEEGAQLSVMLLDGTTYSATLVGCDERTDIGVLKIEATRLPVATFGDSSELKIGETIYAIGNPGGSDYFGSMTSGIVSAIDRSISSSYNMTVIQHDAAINPGNSGGALVNTSGQVVGINSSKIAATDYEGMGFAIPMVTAKSVAESLMAHGYVPNRPKLGIQYRDVSAYQFYSMLVQIKELPKGSLIISAISTDSSLANTDVKVGDMIIAANGAMLDTPDVLLDLIDSSKVGDKITLTICSIDSKSYKTTQRDVEVTLVEDKGTSEYAEEETTTSNYNYGYGGNGSFEDFFNEFFGY